MNIIDIKTMLADILKNPIVKHSFNMKLHDGESGGCDDTSTTVIIDGEFDFSGISLESMIKKAISQATITYQNSKNGRDDLTHKPRETVKIMVSTGRVKLTQEEKNARVIDSMTAEQAQALLAQLTAKLDA